jgi:hypothetical protein
MKIFLKKYFLLVCSVTLFYSCKKDKKEYSDVPEINLVSVSSTSVAEGDPVTFVISYVDGDGDLGENTASVYNLFVTDTRVNVTYKYRIKQLAPDNANIIIKGNLDVLLNSTAITDGSNAQTVVYTIYMVDRAGHQSNTITCSPVTIHN